MENKNHIGTKLFKIRNERGESQEHVAECVGITYVSLSRYEFIPGVSMVRIRPEPPRKPLELLHSSGFSLERVKEK